MATDHRVRLTDQAERYFTCEHCGAYGDVHFTAKGDGGWVREGIFDEDGGAAQARSAENAAADMMVDADRLVRMVRCPACKQRPKGAFNGAYFRVGLPTIVGAIAPFLDKDFIWFSFLAWGFAIYILFRELNRKSRADYAAITNLVKPEKPEKEFTPAAKPRAATAPPKAVAKIAPSAPVAPVVPVRSSAPQIVQQRGPDDGPAFLKGR